MRGVFFSIITVLSWAAFNVAAKHAVDAGYAPVDMMFLRYAVPALFLVPFVALRWKVMATSDVSWSKLALLSLIGGPLFGLMAVSGYTYAPLSHGLMFAPVTVFLTGTALAVIFLGETVTRSKMAGSMVLFLGLALLVGLKPDSLGLASLRGDAMFIAAGMLWGTYTFLMRFWQIPILQGTVGVGLFSALLSIPVLFIFDGGGIFAAPVEYLGVQALLQGVVGGLVSIIALMAALRYVSVSFAALLPAMTPVAAALIVLSLWGTVPNASEISGISVIVLGFFFIGFGFPKILAQQKVVNKH